jgi:hypothetical protein
MDFWRKPPPLIDLGVERHTLVHRKNHPDSSSGFRVQDWILKNSLHLQAQVQADSDHRYSVDLSRKRILECMQHILLACSRFKLIAADPKYILFACNKSELIAADPSYILLACNRSELIAVDPSYILLACSRSKLIVADPSYILLACNRSELITTDLSYILFVCSISELYPSCMQQIRAIADQYPSCYILLLASKLYPSCRSELIATDPNCMGCLRRGRPSGSIFHQIPRSVAIRS